MAVFNMSDLKKGEKIAPQSENSSEMEEKISLAKKHGKEEVESFIKAFDLFKKTVGELVLFEGITDGLDIIFQDKIVNGHMTPILDGKAIPGISDEEYHEIRVNMFTKLIGKYCK